MSDATPKQMANGMTELREFCVSIDWHAPRPTEVATVIARTPEDAKEIAIRMFRRSRTPECVIDVVAITGVGIS